MPWLYNPGEYVPSPIAPEGIPTVEDTDTEEDKQKILQVVNSLFEDPNRNYYTNALSLFVGLELSMDPNVEKAIKTFKKLNYLLKQEMIKMKKEKPKKRRLTYRTVRNCAKRNK